MHARAVDREADDPDETPYREIQSVWAMTVCSSPGSQTYDPGGDFLYMIMDSGAEEHVISYDDWRQLGEPTLFESCSRTLAQCHW